MIRLMTLIFAFVANVALARGAIPRAEKLVLKPKLEKGHGQVVVTTTAAPSGQHSEFDGFSLKFDNGKLVSGNSSYSAAKVIHPTESEKRITSVIGGFVTTRTERHHLSESVLNPEFSITYETQLIGAPFGDRRRFISAVNHLFDEDDIVAKAMADARLADLAKKTGTSLTRATDLVKIFALAGDKNLVDRSAKFNYRCYAYWTWPKEGDLSLEPVGFVIDRVEASGETAEVRIFANRFVSKDCLDQNTYALKLQFRSELKPAAKMASAKGWVWSESLPSMRLSARFEKPLTPMQSAELARKRERAKDFTKVTLQNPLSLAREIASKAPSDHGRCTLTMDGNLVRCNEYRGITLRGQYKRICEGTNDAEQSLAQNLVSTWQFGARCPSAAMVGACKRALFGGQEGIEVFYSAGAKGGWSRETLMRQCQNISPGSFFPDSIP